MGNVNIDACIAALSQLPRLSYDDWLRVLSGLAAEFGADMAYTIAVQAGFRDERRGETLYKLKHPLQRVSFGSVVHVLKQHGIDTHGLHSRTYTRAVVQHPVRSAPTPAPTPVSQPEGCVYRFDDDEAEERAGIYQFDAGMTRYEAEARVLAEMPNAPRSRVFRCAVNTDVRNKDVADWRKFNTSFYNTVLSVSEMMQVVRDGFAICPFVLAGIRSQSNWRGSELCFVDVDGGMTLEQACGMQLTQGCLFVYTTASHTAEKHRFRVVFALPHFERNIHAYKQILEKLITAFGADCTGADAAKCYFGNTNATIWQPEREKL